MKTINLETINAFLKYFQQWYPKTKIVFKSQSLLMKIISVILWPFNKTFLTDFTTTIGNTIYIPANWMTDAQASNTITVIAHEFVHIVDWNKNKIKYVLSYLFPLTMAPILIIGFVCLAFISKWFLLGIPFTLLPYPAYWRMLLELHGYTMSLATMYWTGNTLNDETIVYIASYFTGSAYVFMWPFNTDIISRLDKARINIINGSVLNEPVFQNVYGFYNQNYLLNDNFNPVVKK